MVDVLGLRVLVVLAVVHKIFSQQSVTLNSQVAYRNLEHSSYMENVKLSSYGNQMPLPHAIPMKEPETRQTHITKHPDQKIIHHPSPIYVKRPPTFVTINHPDIIIEPNPVVYHKPAAVVRAPVVYRNLPRKVQYRQVVKHIVKPIERKVVLEEKQPPLVFAQQSFGNGNQPHFQPKYFVAAQSDATELCNRQPTTNIVYQQNILSQNGMVSESSVNKGEVMDNNQYIQPLDLSQIYYKQSFPSSYTRQ